MMGFSRPRTCDRCNRVFWGTSGFTCSPCREKAQEWRKWSMRRKGWNPNAPTPSQEAYAQGDAEMYQRGLRGELD